MRQQVGIEGFCILLPAGTAGGKHRKFLRIPMLHPLQEFTALLHNGQVGAEVGVEYIVKAQPLEGGDHLSGGGGAGSQAELLCPGHPHCGGYLDHSGDLRICQGVQHHEAGVMACIFIFLSRIPETCY